MVIMIIIFIMIMTSILLIMIIMMTHLGQPMSKLRPLSRLHGLAHYCHTLRRHPDHDLNDGHIDDDADDDNDESEDCDDEDGNSCHQFFCYH